MTKKYSVPNNIKNSTMAMAVLEQIDAAVSTWQIATMSFSDSFNSGSGVHLQVVTPSATSWDKDRRNELMAYWNDIFFNALPYKEGGELEVRWAYGTCVVATVVYGKFNDSPVVTVHLGYLDLKEINDWEPGTFDEALTANVILNIEALIPAEYATKS
jgi:hypothetical protein